MCILSSLPRKSKYRDLNKKRKKINSWFTFSFEVCIYASKKVNVISICEKEFTVHDGQINTIFYEDY